MSLWRSISIALDGGCYEFGNEDEDDDDGDDDNGDGDDDDDDYDNGYDGGGDDNDGFSSFILGKHSLV